MLEPSAGIHPDHATTTVVTTAGKTINGVLQSRSKQEIQLLDVEGKLVRIPVEMIELEKPSKTSLMPAGLQKLIPTGQFSDLVAYLGTLRQKDAGSRWPGMPDRMPMV